jgi:hypothetical protein
VCRLVRGSPRLIPNGPQSLGYTGPPKNEKEAKEWQGRIDNAVALLPPPPPAIIESAFQFGGKPSISILSIGDQIQCNDTEQTWRHAQVIDESLTQVYVRYIGWHEKWNGIFFPFSFFCFAPCFIDLRSISL